MDIGYIITVLVVILFSMTLHEAMHGFMAYWLGDDTARLEGRLTLNPVRHIDPFLTIGLPMFLAITAVVTQTPLPIFGGAKPVPFNPARLRFDEWGAALVALSGPLTNLAIAFALFASFALGGVAAESAFGQFLMIGVMVNLGFFVFNMLPIPPLDGSRVVYALAPDFIRRGMEAIESFGLIFIFAIVLLASSFIGQIMITLIQAIVQLFAQIFGLA